MYAIRSYYARENLDLGLGRERDAATVRQHQRDREVAPAVAVNDDLLQRSGHRRQRRKRSVSPGDAARPADLRGAPRRGGAAVRAPRNNFV